MGYRNSPPVQIIPFREYENEEIRVYRGWYTL
jgi:hypothetical protein